MLEITIGVAVFVVILAVPRLRRAFLSFLGLGAIIAAGSAVVALVVWGLYQSKPWLSPDDHLDAEMSTTPAEEIPAVAPDAEADLSSAIASEEAQRADDEQQQLAQQLEQEKLRLANLVGRARYILEEDHKFAAHAALNPLPAGVSDSFSNIIAIRIPAWRNDELAEREADEIRSWLRSIGLTAEETATISTAKAWGSLYDMWIAEKQAAAASGPVAAEVVVSTDASVTVAPTGSATVPAPEIAAEPESEPAPAPPPDIAPVPVPNLPPIARQPPRTSRQVPSRRQVERSPPPRRVEAPRSSPPRRPSPAEREVGPFGY